MYRKPCENGFIYSQQEKQYTTGTMNDSYKLGRFPSNTILTYNETDKEEVCNGFPVENNGSASRYFYCAKASQKDRDEGLGYFEKKLPNLKEYGGNRNLNGKSIVESVNISKRNIHPTVKPQELCQYLVRLVTPKGRNNTRPIYGKWKYRKSSNV